LIAAVSQFARQDSEPSAESSEPSLGASAAVPPIELEPLVSQYLADCQTRVADVRQAIGRGDFELVARHAHNLRGSGSAFGFPPITELGGRLEHAALERDVARLKRDAAELQRYLET
jgi:HPt (histidine-containing phosphotransfer) domain-containing protein